jgi:quinoprotein glucose dehydrogenase
LPKEKQLTGRPNIGGPIVTAGGLIFIAATDDKRFRAFDAKTGKQVWETKLEASGHATPVTYVGKDGKQYVALIATGGSYIADPATSDNVVAYALQ